MATPRSRFRDVLLGFDARQKLGAVAALWDDERRKRFLLRVDALHPVSADVVVWPNLFGDGIGEDEQRRLRLPHATPPAWRGPNQYLWDNLERMRAAIGPLAAKGHPVVAVGWVGSPSSSTTQTRAGPPYVNAVAPARLGKAWSRLGFDVGDAFLTSGLTNCGYTDTDRKKLGRRWKAQLNDYHLFNDAEDALEFAEMTEQRVPEHAPFFVYSLHVLRTHDAAGGVSRRRPST